MHRDSTYDLSAGVTAAATGTTVKVGLDLLDIIFLFDGKASN